MLADSLNKKKKRGEKEEIKGDERHGRNIPGGGGTEFDRGGHKKKEKRTKRGVEKTGG